jgi:hypothetical protein
VRKIWGLSALASCVLAGCAAEYVPLEGSDQAGGASELAVAACEGDDLQYDFNAFAASLAVATANELGRWDALADFQVENGRLVLSATGEMRCGAGCDNIRAILALQQDETSVVPYHSPAVFRGKLTSWHQSQRQKLTALVASKLSMDQGVYRIQARHSGMAMALGWDALTEGAAVGQFNTAAYGSYPGYPGYSMSAAGSDQWRVSMSGTKSKLLNVLSNLCLTLASDSAADRVGLVEKTCSTSDLQLFDIGDMGGGYYSIRDKHGKAVAVDGGSYYEGTPLVHATWNASLPQEQWAFQAVGAETHVPIDTIGTAMFTITDQFTGLALKVDGLAEGAVVAPAFYSTRNDGFNWYIAKQGDKYQLVNRRSGKCFSLLSDSAYGGIGQKACASDDQQLFELEKTGDGYAIVTKFNAVLQVTSSYGGFSSLQQTLASWLMQGNFRLTPILGGEPHQLTFSHATDDGPCGQYFWYEITQPNGLPLRAPAESFVQLIFAGGKDTPTSKDINPFIAQQVDGNLVAIDPSGYMTGGSYATSGSCLETDILYDQSRTSAGKCCVTSTGRTGQLVRSTWNSSTYLCH